MAMSLNHNNNTLKTIYNNNNLININCYYLEEFLKK